jgi:hypothetical protein
MSSSRVTVVLHGRTWGEEDGVDVGVDVGAETIELDDGVLVGSTTSGDKNGLEVGTEAFEENVRA